MFAISPLASVVLAKKSPVSFGFDCSALSKTGASSTAGAIQCSLMGDWVMYRDMLRGKIRF